MNARRPLRLATYFALILFCAGYIAISGLESIQTDGTLLARIDHRLRGSKIRYPADWPLRATPRGQGISGVFVVHETNGKWRTCAPSTPNSVVVTVTDQPAASGFWHPVHEARSLDVRCHPTFENSSELARLLHDIHQEHPKLVSADAVNAYSRGQSSYSRILWLGVLGDLSILSAFAAIFFSTVKLRCEFKWRRPGHCPRCNYSLAGLNAAVCPECGQTLAAPVPRNA